MKYSKTKNGLCSKIYTNQKTASKKRGHTMPKYTAIELKEWMLENERFEDMYNFWVHSNFNKTYIPTVDRLDSNKGYSIDNIRLATFRENIDAYYKELRECKVTHQTRPQKPVIQFNKNGECLAMFGSINEAARRTGCDDGHISKVCNGKRKTTGGYIWKSNNGVQT